MEIDSALNTVQTLKNELQDAKMAAVESQLKPLPGETVSSSSQLAVGSSFYDDHAETLVEVGISVSEFQVFETTPWTCCIISELHSDSDYPVGTFSNGYMCPFLGFC